MGGYTRWHVDRDRLDSDAWRTSPPRKTTSFEKQLIHSALPPEVQYFWVGAFKDDKHVGQNRLIKNAGYAIDKAKADEERQCFGDACKHYLDAANLYRRAGKLDEAKDSVQSARELFKKYSDSGQGSERLSEFISQTLESVNNLDFVVNNYDPSKISTDTRAEVEGFLRREYNLKLILDVAKRRQNNNLTSRLTPVIAGASLLGGLFLLSPAVTGNVISNFSAKTTSLWGIVLILVAVLLAYTWIQAKKNKVEVKQKAAVKKIKKVSKKSRRK